MSWFVFLLLFSHWDSGSSLVRIRKVCDGKCRGGGESSPRRTDLQSWIPLGLPLSVLTFHHKLKKITSSVSLFEKAAFPMGKAYFPCSHRSAVPLNCAFFTPSDTGYIHKFWGYTLQCLIHVSTRRLYSHWYWFGPDLSKKQKCTHGTVFTYFSACPFTLRWNSSSEAWATRSKLLKIKEVPSCVFPDETHLKHNCCLLGHIHSIDWPSRWMHVFTC